MSTGTRAGSVPTTDDSAAGADEHDGAGAPDEEGGDERASSPWARRLAVVATVAAVLPVAVAGFRGALRGWTPTGDNAYSAVRAWDVFSSHPPLLGTWSSASLYSGEEINHPGPLQFDLLAVPVRLLGHGPGTAIGLALINALAVALIAGLVARRLGPAAAALAMGASALLSWSLGSEILYDPWSQHAPLVPFSLFLVAVWCALAGDLVALPVMVVAGSYAFQTHLSYTILVPGLAAIVLVAVLLRARRDRRRDPDAWRRDQQQRHRRWLAFTLLVLLVCWAQPLVEQFSGSNGNLSSLFDSSGADAPRPDLGEAIRGYGGTVAVPPMWLPPSFGSPSFNLNGTGRPTWLAAAALVALAAVLLLLGWRAWRRGSRAVAIGAFVGLLVLVLGFVTTLRMPIRLGFVSTYARFMWPLGMFVWLVLAVALLDEVRARWPRPAPRLVLPGLALALVGGVATLPTVDNESATFPWTIDALEAMDDDIVAAVEGQPGLLVRLQAHPSVGSFGPAVFILLQDAGIPFYVDDEHLVRQLGRARAFRNNPGEAQMQLVVKGGRAAEAEPGEQLVASWSPLSAEEEAELQELTGQLREIVVEHGVPLVEDGDEILEELRMRRLRRQLADARTDPDDILDDQGLQELWAGAPADYDGHPLLDERVFPANLMDRWSELIAQHERLPISIYLAPIEEEAPAAG